MSELVIGPFVGVIGGFAAQRLYEWRKDEGNRKKLKENLKNELERCSGLLTGQGHLLAMSMWSSTVSSGDVKLLSFNDRIKLSLVYFEVENHNYEAKRVRDSAVIAKTDSTIRIDGEMTETQAYWRHLSHNLYLEEFALKDKITKLLQDSLWTK